MDLVRTADRLMCDVVRLVQGAGLSEPQYNVLRILRGAGEEGLPCGRIAGQMLTRAPDVTRLVDRLEEGGLVRRVRPPGADRRIVLVRLTEAGRSLLDRLDEPVERLHRAQFDGLTRAELRELRRLLRRVRQE
ncbi:MAG: MarR family winged helix-turn-helix transcriptional regulator [Gemmatimonadota bacterium]